MNGGKTLLRGGTVVRGDGLIEADVLIEGGKIVRMEQIITPPDDAEVIECGDALVLPGAIDPHTHMGVPIKSITSADDFASGSRAALHGGVTTILDFSVLGEEETLLESVRRRRTEAEASLADVGLHANVTRADEALLAEIPALVEEGIRSFKVFTTYREAGMMLDYDAIERVARAVADAGGLLMVHAEDDQVVGEAAAKLDASAANPALHAEARPAAAEAEAVRRMGKIARNTGCPVYVVHMSSAAGLEAAMGEEGLLVETCPQYLLLTQEAYARPDGRMFVASPPLRTREDTLALWRAIAAGDVHTLGTDHCPFRIEDKPAGQPFGSIPNGIGGVETLLPLMLAQFLGGGLPPERLVQLTAEAPAALFGLAGRKGRVAEGMDADLVVVDPSAVTTDWFGARESGTDWDAFAGLPALFPRDVWRRGERVVERGRLLDASPGEFLPAR